MSTLDHTGQLISVQKMRTGLGRTKYSHTATSKHDPIGFGFLIELRTLAECLLKGFAHRQAQRQCLGLRIKPLVLRPHWSATSKARTRTPVTAFPGCSY